MISERTLKLLQWDTLDVKTLKAIIQIVNEQEGKAHTMAVMHNFSGDYSPTKLKVRQDEIRRLSEFLLAILIGIKQLETKGE